MKLAGFVLATLLAVPLPGTAASQDVGAEKSLAPYFFVKSDDPTDQLPLKSTAADVRIAGVIADVRVTQVYANEGRRPIEAVYVFPASTRAAVYGMKMTIGERVIEAKIDRREDARRQYEAARQQGRGASLLEQQRPNVFQMQVANILPGSEIQVDLRYTEALVPMDRVYEFVYPTVVGPRYATGAAGSPLSEHWVANPYLHAGEAPPYRFDIAVSINAGMPIRDLACASHRIVTSYEGQSAATVKLDASERTGGNRDYVLRYRLSGDRIESGLLLYERGEEKFFLLMLEPPRRIAAADIPGREYIFIVDVSGSMHGFPLEISKQLLRDLIGNLRSTDRFNVLLFSGGSSVMAPESVPATRENVQRAIQVIGRQAGGGGTELLPALQRAIGLPRAEGYSRTVVIATDGYVQVEEQAFDLIRNNLGAANMFTFGIGSAVNRHLIEGMARVGMGEPFVVTRPDEAAAQAERFRKMVQSPVLTGVQVRFRGFEAFDVEPTSIPDVMAERPVMVFGKWRGPARGTMTLAGVSGNGPYRETIEVGAVKAAAANEALRYLWARQRIALLSDYNRLRRDDARIAKVTELGLTYNLLTAYTSFVAVDTAVVNQTGEQATIRQPLSLPQGVSDYAVASQAVPGMSAPGAPMAKTWAAREEASLETSRRDKRERTWAVTRVTVAEGLSKEDILRVLESHVRALDACRAGSGELVLELMINRDGTVKAVKTAKSTLADPGAPACLIAQLRKARFSAPSTGSETRVLLTVTFGS